MSRSREAGLYRAGDGNCLSARPTLDSLYDSIKARWLLVPVACCLLLVGCGLWVVRVCASALRRPCILRCSGCWLLRGEHRISGGRSCFQSYLTVSAILPQCPLGMFRKPKALLLREKCARLPNPSLRLVGPGLPLLRRITHLARRSPHSRHSRPPRPTAAAATPAPPTPPASAAPAPQSRTNCS